MPEIFHSEHVYSYKSYTFGYSTYAKRFDNEIIDPIYEMGFLPYSGDFKSGMKNLYYMARSARVNLLKFSTSVKPAKDYLKDHKMIEFCLRYFEKRHGENVMNEERLRRVLSYSDETYVVEYLDEKEMPIAYVIEIHGLEISHYWFSFFDLDLAYLSFGMWLMIDRTLNARKENKKYYYVGTVYNDKALYKTNIPSLEYWTGNLWVNDIKLLKHRAKTDKEREVNTIDEFKDENK